jgi:hypothetical protein
MSDSPKAIQISRAISPDLMFRGVADTFFDELEQNEVKKVVLDFAGVKSISRSFAHQYIVRRRSSRKEITETNVSRDVSRMLELAKNTSGPKLALPPMQKQEPLSY